MSTHYYATCAIGWATAATRTEAITKLVNANDSSIKRSIASAKKWGDNPGFYIWSCKVLAPEDSAYKIANFQPVGVETEDHKENDVVKVTAKAFELVPSGAVEVIAR